MIFASPFPYGYDREPHYYQPAYHHQRYGRRDERDQESSYDILEQFQAAQEAQRRAKAQKFQRMQAARQEYVNRLEEEEAYRQAYEAAKKRRQIMEEANQVEKYLYGKEYADDESNEEPIFRLIQGPNGQLYKVKVGEKPKIAKQQQRNNPEQEEEATKPIFRVIQGPDGNFYKVKAGEKTRRPQPKPQRRSAPFYQARASSPQQSKEAASFQLIRGPDGTVYRINLDQPQTNDDQQQTRQTKSMSNRADIDYGRRAAFSFSPSTKDSSSSLFEEEAVIAPRRIPIRKSSKEQKRKQKGILVEDASDSESEDDDYKSVWRNRRPSPGQWMEPIQSF